MATLEISLPDIYYEQGDTLSGTYTYLDPAGGTSHQGIVLNVCGYLDTVSVIRGKYGRAALKEHERIYFLKDRKEIAGSGNIDTKKEYNFEYELEPNVAGETLVETYVGVDFSIIYEVTIIVLKGSKVVQATENFHVAVRGQGIKPDIGKKATSLDFKIDPSSLDGSSITSVPKFLFEGRIASTNC